MNGFELRSALPSLWPTGVVGFLRKSEFDMRQVPEPIRTDPGPAGTRPNGDAVMNAVDFTPCVRHVIQRELSFHSAERQEARLLALLKPGTHVQIALCGVERIDAAGMQLLILVQREGMLRGCQVSIVGDSPAVADAIEFCNQAARLGDLPARPRHG